MSQLNPSEMVCDLQEEGWERPLTRSSLPSWTLRTCISPNVTRSLTCLCTCSFLCLELFSPWFIFILRKLNIAVTCKESTLTSPSWSHWAVLYVPPMKHTELVANKGCVFQIFYFSCLVRSRQSVNRYSVHKVWRLNLVGMALKRYHPLLLLAFRVICSSFYLTANHSE